MKPQPSAELMRARSRRFRFVTIRVTIAARDLLTVFALASAIVRIQVLHEMIPVRNIVKGQPLRTFNVGMNKYMSSTRKCGTKAIGTDARRPLERPRFFRIGTDKASTSKYVVIQAARAASIVTPVSNVPCRKKRETGRRPTSAAKYPYNPRKTTISKKKRIGSD
jgi:hypothetical protein